MQRGGIEQVGRPSREWGRWVAGPSVSAPHVLFAGSIDYERCSHECGRFVPRRPSFIPASSESTLFGLAEHITSERFSLQMLGAETNEVLLEGDLQLRDTEFPAKDFEIAMGRQPAKGDYVLRFKNSALTEAEDEESRVRDFELHVR